MDVFRLLCAGVALAASVLPLTARGQGTDPAGVPRISGTVYDSVTRRHLAGAMVQLVRRDNPTITRTVSTDEQGRYAFDNVAANSYLLGFLHQTLDQLGLEPPTVSVDYRVPSPMRVMLATPSRESVRLAMCGDTQREGPGLWIGSVKSAASGGPVSGARVNVAWMELDIRGQAIHRRNLGAETLTNEHGLFAVCGLPTQETMYARAVGQTDSSGTISFFSPADGFIHSDLYVGAAKVDTIAGPDTTSGELFALLSGEGRLTGNVRTGNGRAVPNARIVFWGREREVTTNSNGAFSLDSLPLGTHTVEVRALGFIPERRPVHVFSASAQHEDFVLESRETYLDTVRVIGRRAVESSHYREFLARKGSGWGQFLDEDDLSRRNAVFVSDLLRSMPGVHVTQGGFRGRVLMRGQGARALCNPSLFVDGMRMQDGAASLEQIVSAEDIRGIEVYTRTAGMPPQFEVYGCGSIVIWTGRRRSTPADPERRRE
jgi:hypothetical protein